MIRKLRTKNEGKNYRQKVFAYRQKDKLTHFGPNLLIAGKIKSIQKIGIHHLNCPHHVFIRDIDNYQTYSVTRWDLFTLGS